MFSGINEAWNNDPVKDITRKLSSGSFSQPSDMAKAFNVKNTRNNLNDEKVKREHYESITLDDSENDEITDASISLYSTCNSDNTPYAPVNVSYKHSHAKKSTCNFNHRHLSRCTECRNQLKKMINSNIKKRMSDILLELKLKELHMYGSNTNNNETHTNSIVNDNWKEVAILVMGSIIALLVIYLIIKSINK